MNNVSVLTSIKRSSHHRKKDGEIWFVLSDVCNVLEIGMILAKIMDSTSL